MKKPVLIILLSICCNMAWGQISGPDCTTLIQHENTYLVNLGCADGAIRMSHEVGDYNSGYYIEPYFANIAAGALLQTQDNEQMVIHYMSWYLSKIDNQTGVITDYWIKDPDDPSTEKIG